MRQKRIWTVTLVLALALALLPTQPAYAATITVDTTGDVLDAAAGCGTVTVALLPGPDGDISLREAMCAANNNAGSDTIAFNIAGCGGGVCTIQPTIALPVMTGGGTTINGYTQTGAVLATSTTPATLRIEIDGTNVANNNGFNIISAGNVISGVVINRFGGDGVLISGSGATGNVIAGNHIGTDVAGAADRGNGLGGVYISEGAQNNTVGGDTASERNVLSGNGWEGVGIHGSNTMSNTISGNYIGTSAGGTADLGNTLDGVRIYGGAKNNTVGGDTIGERNLISGNDQYGVRIAGSGATSNTISGNYIGLAANGTDALGNDSFGIYILNGAQNNIIGGDAEGERNVISGNDEDGVRIAGSGGTTGNVVSGNYIGTDAGGTLDRGNGWSGVAISGGRNNTVGGDVEGERNVISSNDQYGVEISDSGTMSNTVSGNTIGTDKNGTADLGNTLDGVYIHGGAQNNTVGGTNATPGGSCSGDCNLISSNDQHGVYIADSGTAGNTVSGNYIGTDKNGTADLGNSESGVDIYGGAQNNTVGGDADGERNVISGNNGSGVCIEGSGTMSNTVSGNYIGTDKNGTADLGNSSDGVGIGEDAQNNTVGGDVEGERNVISGNDDHGVLIGGSGTMSNTVSGNYIGTDKNGTADLGNARDGVYITTGPQNNTVGGDAAGEGNLISGNNQHGVEIYDSDGNTVSGNTIGVNITGTADLGNSSDGVYIYGGAQNNTVGGDVEGERNVISGNDWFGVEIYGSGTTGNTVSGNTIGTDINGAAGLGNTEGGVYIYGGAQNNTVGGDAEGERNVISGNDGSGVYIQNSGTTGNTVSGNYIGVNITGTAVLSNTGSGVSIGYGAQNNTVGGDAEGERNVISGNDQQGVSISDSGTTSNTVSGNYIGTDVNGTADRGNGSVGVSISDGAQNNTVGGDTEGERNVISGNGYYGVDITGSGTTGNTVSGNYIGTDRNGTADLGNTMDGVYIYSGAQNNTVGGDAAGERNVISGNDVHGVDITGSGTTGNTVSGNYIGVAANGTADRGNSGDGVNISGGAQNNAIGGDAAGERNVISGNDWYGVYIYGSNTTSNTVSGNYIGVAANGTADLGNTQYGVYIVSGAQNNTVGPGNVIAHNDGDGVQVEGSSTTGNTVTHNSIYANAMGIDLANGANGNIKAPVIVTTTAGSVHVVGTACPNCTVEVFRNSDTDGEGETYIGNTTATASGNFTVTVSSLSDPYLTATATKAISGTSEFSGVFTATVPLAPPVSPAYLPIIVKNASP